MKKVLMIIMVLTISVAFVTTAMAQERSRKVGKTITITGCLHKGTEPDSYVMLGVSERSADASAPIVPRPTAIYWLDSTEGLKDLAGKMVDVTGTVTSRGPQMGHITISTDPYAVLQTDVKVDTGADRNVATTEKFDYSQRTKRDPRSASALTTTWPVYNIAVENVRAATIVGAPGPVVCQFGDPIIILASEPTVVVEERIKVVMMEPKIEERVIVLAFEDIHFDYNSAILTSDAQTILRKNIRMLRSNPKASVRVAGYTSASGTEEYNQKLSERRANAVNEFLVKEGGISRDRLSTIGYGENRPAEYEGAPRDLYSPAAKANMRVLFEVVVK